MQNESMTPPSSSPSPEQRKQEALSKIKDLLDHIYWIDTEEGVYPALKALVEFMTGGESTLTLEEANVFINTFITN